MSDDKRLASVREKLATINTKRNAENKVKNDQETDQENMAVGLRAGTELITAIIAGGLIGYGLDRWLDTKPFFLIAMLVLGVITGFVNVWRTTQNMGHSVGYKDQDKQE